jgi:hypothetical protein
MTVDEALALVGTWPVNRSVPRKLADAIKAARGLDRAQLSMMTEILMAASEKAADYELIEKYLG